MSVSISFLGSTRVIPERKETGWGITMTNVILDLIRSSGGLVIFLTGTTTPVPFLPVTPLTLNAGATLTQAAAAHRVQGNAAPVTLSAVTAIAAGQQDGQLLELYGAHATNTVKIQNGAGTRIAGDIILGLGHSIGLIWNAGAALWEERFRNN